MRKMTKDGLSINVVEHIILKNGWEYYISEEDTGHADVKFALVCGYETELGNIYLHEIKNYVISKTKNLKEVAPAPGWEWSPEQ